MNGSDFVFLLPEIVLVATAITVWTVDFFTPRDRKPDLAWPAAAGALVAMAFLAISWGEHREMFLGTLRLDNFSLFFRFLFLAVAFFVIVGSPGYVRRNLKNAGEFYGLILMSTVGAMGIASSREFLTAYISLELVTFGFYVLASHARHEARSNEAGAKYLILGAFSSGLLLFGISLIFGATGSTSYAAIAAALETTPDFGMVWTLGVALVLAGLGFKVAAFPFHSWAPDVYEGAPLPITAFLSVGSKAAGFAFLIRLFAEGLLPVLDDWRVAIGVVAVLTMTFGNLVAIQQSNLKRLLAYSSIAQAGYILVGMATLSADTTSGMLLHIAGYTATNLGVFLVVIYFHNLTGKEEINDLRGLYRRSFLLTLVLAVSLLSLAGMPLFAGFMTKFYLFTAAAASQMWWLIALAVANSILSVYYYLLVLRQAFITPESEEEEQRPAFRLPSHARATLSLLMVLVLWIGIYPSVFVDAAEAGSRALFGG
jgi:NADH-quinone oxidoreductase subunit N